MADISFSYLCNSGVTDDPYLAKTRALELSSVVLTQYQLMMVRRTPAYIACCVDALQRNDELKLVTWANNSTATTNMHNITHKLLLSLMSEVRSTEVDYLPTFLRPMAHDPSSLPQFLLPETGTSNFAHVPCILVPETLAG